MLGALDEVSRFAMPPLITRSIPARRSSIILGRLFRPTAYDTDPLHNDLDFIADNVMKRHGFDAAPV